MSEPRAGIFQTLDKTASYPYTRKEYLRRLLWNFVQATLFRWSWPHGFRWRRFLLRSFGAKIADTGGVHASVTVFHPWLLELGEWTMIGRRTVVYNLGPIKIGDHTVISQDAYLCAGTHDFTLPTLPLQRPPIDIGAGVWIAAGAFIGPGVTIGDNCVIGARAVVFKDIPAGMVAAGNPCKVIKPREMNAPPSAIPSPSTLGEG